VATLNNGPHHIAWVCLVRRVFTSQELVVLNLRLGKSKSLKDHLASLYGSTDHFSGHLPKQMDRLSLDLAMLGVDINNLSEHFLDWKYAHLRNTNKSC